MGRRPKSGRLRPKVCHRTADTHRRASAGAVNRRELYAEHSLSSGHLGHAQRCAGRIISGAGQLPRSLRKTEQYVPGGQYVRIR